MKPNDKSVNITIAEFLQLENLNDGIGNYYDINNRFRGDWEIFTKSFENCKIALQRLGKKDISIYIYNNVDACDLNWYVRITNGEGLMSIGSGETIEKAMAYSISNHITFTHKA